MSTRALYTFWDDDSVFHVYKHSDGYPSGAIQWIKKALTLAWTLPRFEADEFAAAFISANKDGSGGVYLSKGKHGDLAYHYEIRQNRNIPTELEITIFELIYDEKEKKRLRVFQGSLTAMKIAIENEVL